MNTKHARRGFIAAILVVGMIGLGAGSASARPPVRCDGTFQTTGVPGGQFGLGPKGTSEHWTSWVATQDGEGNATWQYTYVITTYFGPFGAVLQKRSIETCVAG